MDSESRLWQRRLRHANGDAAKALNISALADLKATADSAQQAAHIRGIVATTMAHLSVDATGRHTGQRCAVGEVGARLERRAACRQPGNSADVVPPAVS
jgi:hypothetical protein